jgi:hypothetical protein
LRIPDPGGKKAPDPGSGSATLLQVRVVDPDSTTTVMDPDCAKMLAPDLSYFKIIFTSFS